MSSMLIPIDRILTGRGKVSNLCRMFDEILSSNTYRPTLQRQVDRVTIDFVNAIGGLTMTGERIETVTVQFSAPVSSLIRSRFSAKGSPKNHLKLNVRYYW
jgi:hypothetical protein